MEEPDEDLIDEQPHGENPPGLGPEVFRDRLTQVSGDAAEAGAHITFEDEQIPLGDIESVDRDPAGGHSRIRLRNGVVIGGLTGAAIVAALATVRFRHRHR